MKLLKRCLIVLGLLLALLPMLALSFVILSLVSPTAVVIGVVCMVLAAVWLLLRWRNGGGAGSNPESGSMFNRSKEGLL